MSETWAIYGATGYTGKLLVDEAVKRGHRPLLLGRSVEKLKAVAEPHGLSFRAVPLDDPGGLRAALEGQQLVLHAAGPFTQTSEPMVRACLDIKAHYLDITGELNVFQAVFAQDEAAVRRGVCLMSGVGFDVVPTDCLAAHVVSRVKRPKRLELAIAAIGQPSGGTARSVVEMLPGGIRARVGGRIVQVPAMKGIKTVRFSKRDASVMPAPLADLESAFHTTGVEDIRCYVAVPKRFGQVGRALWPLAAATFPVVQALLRNDAVRQRLGEFAHGRSEGPDEATRTRGRSFAWARVEADGGAVESVLSTLEGYEFTKLASVRIVERVLADKPVGARSPAQVVGKDFVLGLPDTVREDR